MSIGSHCGASAAKVVENPEHVFYELSAGAASNARGERRPLNPRPACATCAAVLDRTRFLRLELDVCPEHGTWFDALELCNLVSSVRERTRIQERDASGGSIACAACRNIVLRTKTHITGEGTLCDDCYLSRQPEMAAAAEMAKTPSGSVLLELHKALYEPKT